ncbi:MAG TPA: hypothetical protein VFY23_10170 [Candidatus Limnocylindrales bacterium]|nr:hypothetical protein [Candidatus Limnocylindrales bacterium]
MLAIDGVPIRRRLGSAHARDRLAEALFEIAREGFDHAFTGPDAPAARAWLRVALERPITRATDAALDRFCAELGLAALAAPAHVRRSLAITDEDAGGEPVSAVRAVRARHAREATSG